MCATKYDVCLCGVSMCAEAQYLKVIYLVSERMTHSAWLGLEKNQSAMETLIHSFQPTNVFPEHSTGLLKRPNTPL